MVRLVEQSQENDVTEILCLTGSGRAAGLETRAVRAGAERLSRAENLGKSQQAGFLQPGLSRAAVSVSTVLLK